MTLYHGSSVPDLTELRPFPSNHGKPYVYLTDSPTLPLFYAYNPIARPGGFFPYWFDKAGQLHYDEYFPHQLQQMCAGHDGWIYHAKADGLDQLDKMPWVYLSESPVQVTKAVHIPDLYTACWMQNKLDVLFFIGTKISRKHSGKFIAKSCATHWKVTMRMIIYVSCANTCQRCFRNRNAPLQGNVIKLASTHLISRLLATALPKGEPLICHSSTSSASISGMPRSASAFASAPCPSIFTPEKLPS